MVLHMDMEGEYAGGQSPESQKFSAEDAAMVLQQMQSTQSCWTSECGSLSSDQGYGHGHLHDEALCAMVPALQQEATENIVEDVNRVPSHQNVREVELQPVRWTPRETTPTNQIDLILSFTAAPQGVGSHCIYDVLSIVQHDKILWLALHGIPSRSVAWEMRYEVDKHQTRKGVEQHVQALETLIRLFIGELARGGDRDPDIVVDRLWIQATKYFDIKTLHRAMEHAVMDVGNEISAGRLDRIAVRKAHQSSKKTLQALELFDPGTVAGYGTDSVLQSSRKATRSTLVGMGSDSLEEYIFERLGFHCGKPEEEKQMMKERLLQIRETGGIPQRLEKWR